MIERVINNINVELDIIEVQSIRCENDLMLLFQSFILKVDKLIFSYTSESINLEILWSRTINDFDVILRQHVQIFSLSTT